jgi:hypothetical protein
MSAESPARPAITGIDYGTAGVSAVVHHIVLGGRISKRSPLLCRSIPTSQNSYTVSEAR